MAQLTQKEQDDLKELIHLIRLYDGKGGCILLGFSGPLEQQDITEELSKNLNQDFMLKTVNWPQKLSDLIEIFPPSDPRNCFYFLHGLLANLKDDVDTKTFSDTTALLNLTSEFYLQNSKLVLSARPVTGL